MKPKIILSLLIVLLSLYSVAQTSPYYDSLKNLQRINTVGNDNNSARFRGALIIPRDTFKLAQRDSSAIAIKNNMIYTWNGKKWLVNAVLSPTLQGVLTAGSTTFGRQMLLNDEGFGFYSLLSPNYLQSGNPQVSSTLGPGFIELKNLTGTQRMRPADSGSYDLKLPTKIGFSNVVIPITVNGIAANDTGNIILPVVTSTLQQVTNSGNITTKDIIVGTNADLFSQMNVTVSPLQITFNGLFQKYSYLKPATGNSNLRLPNIGDGAERILTGSVNGVLADNTGNITLALPAPITYTGANGVNVNGTVISADTVGVVVTKDRLFNTIANYVTLNTAQTITGAKTFSNLLSSTGISNLKSMGGTTTPGYGQGFSGAAQNTYTIYGAPTAINSHYGMQNGLSFIAGGQSFSTYKSAASASSLYINQGNYGSISTQELSASLSEVGLYQSTADKLTNLYLKTSLDGPTSNIGTYTDILIEAPDLSGGATLGTNYAIDQQSPNAKNRFAGNIQAPSLSTSVTNDVGSLIGNGNILAGNYNYAAGSSSNIISGRNNVSYSSSNLMGGAGNYSYDQFNFTTGLFNSNNGQAANAIGYGLITRSEAEFASGKYNANYTAANNLTDRLFSIGFGTAESDRKDLLRINKNGEVKFHSGSTLYVASLATGLAAPTTTGLTEMVIVDSLGKFSRAPRTSAFDSGAVRLTTAQTIAGQKTFTQSVDVEGNNNTAFSVIKGKAAGFATPFFEVKGNTAGTTMLMGPNNNPGGFYNLTVDAGYDVALTTGLYRKFIVNSNYQTEINANTNGPNDANAFLLKTNTGNRFSVSSGGAARLWNYGTGARTAGTPKYNLQVDSLGNIIEANSSLSTYSSGVGINIDAARNVNVDTAKNFTLTGKTHLANSQITLGGVDGTSLKILSNGGLQDQNWAATWTQTYNPSIYFGFYTGYVDLKYGAQSARHIRMHTAYGRNGVQLGKGDDTLRAIVDIASGDTKMPPISITLPTALTDSARKGSIEVFNDSLYYTGSSGIRRRVIRSNDGATVAGTNGQIQFNNNGVFGGNSGLSYNGSNSLTLAGLTLVNNGATGLGLTATNNGQGGISLDGIYNFNNAGGYGIKVGGGGTHANPVASLELLNTTKGFLPNRLTTVQRDAIPTPPEGLEIYNLTTHTKDFFNGTVWKSVLTN